MKTQLFSKIVVSACIVASLYVTLNLLNVYVEAVTGELYGAGGAQWQFAFLMAPLPAVLGFVALGISRFSRPSLSLAIALTSAVSAFAPLILLGLVVLHAY
jgi:hypothetical protein